MTWPTVKLGDVCEINPRFAGQLSQDETVSIVPMAAVSEVSGSVIDEQILPLNKVKSGLTSFRNQDILFAKITPCFENGKIAQANISQEWGFGSTEFHVVRPNEKADGHYLLHLLRAPIIREDGAKQMTGSAGQKRVPKHYLANLEIPLPPLEEQKRLAAILDRAAELRRMRLQVLAGLDELAQSLFLELFGDPATNPQGWDVVRLEELMNIRRGASPRPIDNFLGGTVNWIKIGDGTKGSEIYLEKCAQKVTEAGAKKSVYLREGSLIFANCGVSLGFARILKIDGCIHDGWLAFENITEKLDKIFLLKALNGMTMNFRAMAPDGTQPNLNTRIMKDFGLILPPLELQQQFAQQIEELEAIKVRARASLSELDALFAALQARAFAGELSGAR